MPKASPTGCAASEPLRSYAGPRRRVPSRRCKKRLHSYIYEHGDKMEPYGAYRWGLMHPNRSALDLGIPVAGTSDWPVSAADPLLRIQDLVTRRSAEGKVYGPQQIISAEEAIAVWTLGSAYASFEEKIKGSIEPGKLADFVVLSADPTRVAGDAIRSIQVEQTFIGGKCVYQRDRFRPVAKLAVFGGLPMIDVVTPERR